MSSQHHGFLWPREANRTTLKTTPSPPRGGDLIFRAIWGIFSTLCIHGICTVRGLDGRNLDSSKFTQMPPPRAFLAPPSSWWSKVPLLRALSALCYCLSLTEHTPQKYLQAICPSLPRGVQASQARARSYSFLCPWKISETQVFMERKFNYHHESLAGTSLASFQIKQWRPSVE